MKTPKLRLDRGRDFSSVHGERAPGDRHATVHFYQDLLPFDAQGFLLMDHPDVTENPKLVALVERKLKKLEKTKPVAAEDDTDALSDDDNDVDGDDDEDDDVQEPVNLEMWARGEAEYPWQEISNAIAIRFKRRVPSKQAAIEFLIEERVVSIGALSKSHQKLVKELV